MKVCNEFNATLRFGHVKEYDEARHMARVYFPDMGLISHWLPVIVPNSIMNHDELHVDLEEHVACLMQGQGTEAGIIIGAFYDDKNKPPVKKLNIRSVIFSDGTQVLYDRKEHVLEVNCAGEVRVRAPKILLDGGVIELDGSVVCPGYCRC